MKGEDMDPTMKYPGELTPRVVLTCLLAATGGLIFGYDHGVSGGVTSMDSFLEKFFPSVYAREANMKPSSNQYCKFNSQILTLFTSSLYLTALISGLGASTITRKLGRRATMMIGGVFFVLGALLNGLAIHIWMLIVGRMLLGFGIGCANQSVPIYVSEMAPYKYRGALNMCFQLSITIGIFGANLVNYYFVDILNGQGWRLSLGLGAVPAVIFLVGSFFLPDSPSSLVERDRLEEAKQELIKIRGTPNIAAEFNDIVAARESSKHVKHPWATLRQRKSIGFGSTASLMSAVIIGSVKPVSTLISILVVDKFGRRTLFMEGGLQMLVCQIIMAIAIGIEFGTSGIPAKLPHWYSVVVVGVICVYVAGFAWSWGPLGWLVPSEVFSLEVRPAAQSITVGVNMISTFIIAQLFTLMLCHLKFGLFIFFGCFVVIMTAFVYKLVPETKGIPIEDMSRIWDDHPFWGRYVRSTDEDTKSHMGNSK
ncbi:hypothetical protein K1719_027970 [Acacia pycnantha]|nr:hypothetical protein K1719_027970 [Acacia pycnantha]